MNKAEEWRRWLAEVDSTQALVPEGYDESVAEAWVHEIGELVSTGLSDYNMKTASPELYQDSTGLAHCHVTSKMTGTTICWILLSHFGKLVTVQDCHDTALLKRIRDLLERAGQKYIDYTYLTNTKYEGKCKKLMGWSLADRYFELMPQFNDG